MSTSPTIGWIGCGRMGYAMAARLLKAGHAVTVYNRTRAKAEPLTEYGAVIVDRPGDLAHCDIVFTMVSASADFVQVTTGDGPREAFDEVAGLLGCMARAVTYAGEGEVARLVKLAHNIFLGVVTQSLAEITVLAEKGGVPRAAFLEFLNDSVMGSTFTRYKTPAFVNLDLTPTFTPVLLRKDFDLGLAAARELEVPMPVAALTHQIVQDTVGRGHRENDFAALLIEAAAAAGLELRSENVQVSDGLGAS